jgi:adenylate cyclase class 2
MKKYEVEQKFPVADRLGLERRLASLVMLPGEPELQVDRYYAHPMRDFADTDEALRIRRVGPANYLTYKGPKIDATTKTRREVELPLSPGDEAAAALGELLEALGFRPVAEVRKSRRKLEIPWQGRLVEAALDEVEQVGSFVELELLAEEAELSKAKACLASLAEHLCLEVSERRSYLELLLSRHERTAR